MHWQVVDDIPGPEPQDVRLASVETESTGPRPFFNVDQAAFKSLEPRHHSVRRLATCHHKSDSRLRTGAASVDAVVAALHLLLVFLY